MATCRIRDPRNVLSVTDLYLLLLLWTQSLPSIIDGSRGTGKTLLMSDPRISCFWNKHEVWTTYTILKCCFLLVLWITIHHFFTQRNDIFLPLLFLLGTFSLDLLLDINDLWLRWYIPTYHQFHLLINLFNYFWLAVVCWPEHSRRNRCASASEGLMF